MWLHFAFFQWPLSSMRRPPLERRRYDSSEPTNGHACGRSGLPALSSLFDKYTETGLAEGARSKKGKNGTQFLLGGMRSGHGTTFGVGYRRVDLWDEKLAFRVTARGTL